MKILIDADGCPVVRLATNLGKEHGLEVLVFADTAHIINSDYAKVIIVDKGKDAVDFELIKHAAPGDVVVTSDYGLASMALTKEAYAIGFGGLVFTMENIDSLLGARYANQMLRRLGERPRGSKIQVPKVDKNFRDAFKRICTEVVKV